MNKLIIFVLLLTSNCALLLPDQLKVSYKSQLPHITNPVEASKWVSSKLTYDESYATVYFKHPSTILANKKGVCLDYCILTLYVLGSGDLILCKVGKGKHTIIRYKGIYYDVLNEIYDQNEINKNMIIYGYYTFEEVDLIINTTGYPVFKSILGLTNN